MGCFSFLKFRDGLHRRGRPPEDDEADVVLQSLELMKSSQRVSIFPSLRWIHAPNSKPIERNNNSYAAFSFRRKSRSDTCEFFMDGLLAKWEPLHVLIEKGKFKGKPMPLPAPPNNEDSLVPPLVVPNQLPSLPHPSDSWGIRLKCFRFDELASACQGFSPKCCIREGHFGKVYKCLMHIRDGLSIGKKQTEVAVVRLIEGPQDLEAWIAKIKWLARLQNPNICKLIGFCASNPRRDRTWERLLVYEHCTYGSLDGLLSKSQYIRPLDWSTRVNIAVGAAKGLAYLHQKALSQIVYTDFTAASILIDNDFNAKLSDYGFHSLERKRLSRTVSSSAEIRAPDWDDYARSDVGNFGLVLLELLVGSRNMRKLIAKKGDSERWIPRLLRDESKLDFILDSELRAEPYPKSMKRLAAVGLRCLRKDSHRRPTMKQVVALLEPLKSLEELDGPQNSESALKVTNFTKQNSSCHKLEEMRPALTSVNMNSFVR